MYEAQFELKRRPFGATPDPRCFLAVGSVRAALDEIVVCVEQGQGIAIVSAPAGTGKTLLCERLKTELEDRFQVVILRHASFLTRRALLQTVLAELNHSYRRHEEQELRLELVPAIRALQPAREALVLICDEAHLLTEDLLEELRILSDVAELGHPLVRLVLVGQPPLEETLAGPPLEALNQRVRAHVALDPFDRATSREYLDYRVTWAGGRLEEVFTPEAIEAICQASQGVPRCMNQLCDHALLLAYVAEERPVGVETIREALRDLRQLPLHWNETLHADSERVEPVAITATPEPVGESAAYEVVEFGADLPVPHVSTELPTPIVDAAIATEMIIEELGAAVAELEDETLEEIEEELADEFDEPNAERELAAVSILRRPITFEPTAVNDVAPANPSAVVEEVVCDRYAAIDGGYPIPEPTPAAPPIFRGNLTPATDVEPVVRWQVPASAGPQPWELAEPEELATDLADISDSEDLNDGFDAVCNRLEELLPEVPPESAWTSTEAHDISDMNAVPHAIYEVDACSEGDAIPTETVSELETAAEPAVVEAEPVAVENAALVDDETESPEASLSRQISELIDDLQSVARPADEAVAAVAEPPTVEVVVEAATVSASASTTERSARPYRNLFSQLRRKQQGLA